MAFDSIVIKLLGRRNEVEYDRYFMTMICLTATVFLLLLCCFHIIMGLKLAPVFLAGGSSIILFGMYLLVRFKSCLIIPKLIVTILGLILLDITWYAKFMSLGPVLFFIFAFGALIVWVWNKRAMIYMLIVYFINISILFLIEYTNSEFAFEYENLRARTGDIYLSFFLYSLLLIFILSRVKKDFMVQKENAIRSDKLKSAFLANLSHEIRTPMNAIMGFSNLLEQDQEEETRKKYIHNIQNSSTNLLRIINEILDLSKIEAGYSEIVLTTFKIEKLFKELNDLTLIDLKRREKHNIEIVFNKNNADKLIRSDYVRLFQILSNLLNNATKFSTDGKISVDCEVNNTEIVFSVADEGPGIPLEKQNLVFERFTKFDYNGINTEGSGIGLSIAKKIVEILGGNIWINSNIGEGSTFHFSIPFLEPRHETIKINKRKEIKDKTMHTNSEQLVLVVEDDKSSFLLIQQVLKSMKIDLHRVRDGKDAIEFVEKNPATKVILMDLKLPFMDGYEATTEIKKINSNIVVIAQTAYAMQGDKEKALNAGCDEYMTKPLDFAELKELVQSHLSGKN